MAFTLFIRSNPVGGATFTADTLAALVARYEEFRDGYNLGASELSHGRIKKSGSTKVVAWISYNGRLWTAKPGTPSSRPMTLVSL